MQYYFCITQGDVQLCLRKLNNEAALAQMKFIHIYKKRLNPVIDRLLYHIFLESHLTRIQKYKETRNVINQKEDFPGRELQGQHQMKN